MKTTTYKFFSTEVTVPLVTYTNGVVDDIPKDSWHDTLYVCSSEDMYALLNPRYRNKTIRVVHETDCQKARFKLRGF